jgi:endonuclease YncB( thermonuclease family)
VLVSLLGAQPVECTPLTRDRYGRTVARCYAGGEDLGALMVSAGWAWAYMKYSLDYVPREAWAAINGRGVHGHQCERPHQYRADQRTGR